MNNDNIMPNDDFDPDDAPPLGREFFERAALKIGNKVIRPATGTLTRPGRPPLGDAPKVQQTLRLSRDVLDHFRAGGPGWQSRIDDALRAYVRTNAR